MAIHQPDAIKVGEDLLAPEINNPKQQLAYQRVLAALIASQHSENGWCEVGADDDAERLRASARRIAESDIWGTFEATTRTGLSPSTGQRVLQVRFAELHGLTLEQLESDDGLAMVSRVIREANDGKA